MKAFVGKALLFCLLIFASDRGLSALLTLGLNDYFGLDKPAQVLCVGHSHTMLGIDGELLEKELGVPVAKFAVNGANVSDRLAMLKHYFEVDRPNIKVVVYDVDDHIFNNDGLSSNSYRLFFPFMDSDNMRDYIAGFADDDELMTRRSLKTLRFNGITFSLALRGLLGVHQSVKAGVVNVEEVKRAVDEGRATPIVMSDTNLRLLEETIGFLHKKDVAVVFAYIPTIDLLNHVEENMHRDIVKCFEKLATEQGVFFHNYNRKYESRHELFYDMTHLNSTGQGVITKELLSDVSILLNANLGDSYQ